MRTLKLVLLFLLCANASFAKDSDRLQYEFIKLKDGYAFSGKCFIKTNEVCLLDIVYEPEHLKETLGNKYAIDVIGSGNGSYDVRYIYKTPFGEIKSTYRKTLKLTENKVIFEMIANEQKGVFLPRLLSSKGSYQIKKEADGCWLEYYQEGTFERSTIKNIYLFFAKNEAIKFLRDLEKYAKRICH